MLMKIFLPLSWHFCTWAASSGQVARPGATAASGGRLPGQIHGPKSTVG